jgi:hypothetical protein
MFFLGLLIIDELNLIPLSFVPEIDIHQFLEIGIKP